MSKYNWRTLDNGFVEVDLGDGAGYQVITIKPDASTERVLTNWVPLAQKNAIKHNIPASWILAFIYSESGGNPNAENYCCAGLMAIYYSIHGMTREEALDPETNVDKATGWIADSVHAKGLDLPQAASVHNAGGGTTGTPHEAPGDPWGMRENTGTPYGFIERVVRANNYFLQQIGNVVPQPFPPDETPPGAIPAAAGSSFITKLVPFIAGSAFGYYFVKIMTKYVDQKFRTA